MSLAKRHRRGITVQEAVVTSVLAIAAITGVAQLLVLNARQWVSAQQHAIAVREAGNLMEEALSRPWAELTGDGLAAPELPASTGHVLPGARVALAVKRDEAWRDAVQVRIQIDWKNTAGQRAAPVRLAAWRYAPEEAAP